MKWLKFTKDKGEDTPKKPKEFSWRKCMNITGIVLCILMIPVLVLNGTLFIKSIFRQDAPPDFMGNYPLVAGNDNMTTVFDENDLVIVKALKDGEEPEVGTVVAFWVDDGVVIQRIVDTEETDDQRVLYLTKSDTAVLDDSVVIGADQILGKYASHINGLGGFVVFTQSPAGIFTVAVLPMGLLFLAFHLIDKKRYSDALKLQQEVGEG